MNANLKNQYLTYINKVCHCLSKTRTQSWKKCRNLGTQFPESFQSGRKRFEIRHYLQIFVVSRRSLISLARISVNFPIISFYQAWIHGPYTTILITSSNMNIKFIYFTQKDINPRFPESTLTFSTFCKNSQQFRLVKF